MLARKGFLPNYDVDRMLYNHLLLWIAVLCLRLSSGMLKAVPSQSLENRNSQLLILLLLLLSLLLLLLLLLLLYYYKSL